METQPNTVEHSGVEGNTKTSNPTTRSRGWCYTWNNYTEDDWKNIVEWSDTETQQYVVGKEVGASGTPHLQGYVYFKNAKTFKQMKDKWGQVHWEKAKGKPDDNFKYCSKDNDYKSKGFEVKLSLQEQLKARLMKKYQAIKWKPWQQEILDLIKTEPDDRTIHWVFDPKGNSGKSFLCKYLLMTEECIIADGKKDNVMNQVKIKLVDEEKEFRVVLLDIPRSSEGYINYGVIEQLKNGFIYSGKYEGGQCIFDNVHVIVFANFLPDYTQFSEDRWNTVDLS